MKHDPTNPEVIEAYEAMANETLEQYKAIEDSGIEFEIYEGKGEPYANSKEMLADLENGHLYVLSTENDFGQEEITDKQREENPLLRDSGIKDKNGKPLLVNDVFRGVHDTFGHGERGNGFGAKGEENAWDIHSRMYSPKARRAMTTETRGQNSWVNFGKQMRNEDGSIKKKGEEGYMSPTERPFAEQKIGLLPEEFSDNPYVQKSEAFTKSEQTDKVNSNNVDNALEMLEPLASERKEELTMDEFSELNEILGENTSDAIDISKDSKLSAVELYNKLDDYKQKNKQSKPKAVTNKDGKVVEIDSDGNVKKITNKKGKEISEFTYRTSKRGKVTRVKNKHYTVAAAEATGGITAGESAREREERVYQVLDANEPTTSCMSSMLLESFTALGFLLNSISFDLFTILFVKPL
jgi:hypothetical protein